MLFQCRPIVKCAATSSLRTWHSTVRRQVQTSAGTFLSELNRKSTYTPHTSRGFLRVDGKDAVKFLQGLVTGQMNVLSERGGWCGFLNAPGRILYDAFIYPLKSTSGGDAFLLECSSDVCPKLLQHLKRFKLRAKLTVTDVSAEFSSYHLFPSTTESPLEKFKLGIRDHRAADAMGYRVVGTASEKVEEKLQGYERSSEETYKLRRILLGVPEGPQDFWEGSGLPLEAGWELLGGVDFRKGCYLGQELTIRTHHTGVIRKRIVPVQIFKATEPIPPPSAPVASNLLVDTTSSLPLPSPQADIYPITMTGIASKKRGVGKFCEGLHNVGLALVRLDMIGEEVVLSEPDDLRARAMKPDWWPTM
ncbi:ccr4 associated factor [Gaertneriomyces sp. JEL0708]|nr:ccr4 associated factor [Gaertneriomyces sp. JEL0708]